MLANMLASVVNTPTREYIKENLETVSIVRIILTLMKECKTCQFWVEDGLLWAKDGRLYVSKVRDLQRKLLRVCHDTLWVDHLR